MSTKYLSNAFLPSGGVDCKPFRPSNRSTPSVTSPLTAPRPPSDYMSTQNKPLSPPQSRSPSAENNSAAMVEDWRSYTATLRSQFKGEKAHMEADRKRMEECMDEERELWELERSYFVAQVAELEAKIESLQLQVKYANRSPPGSQAMSTSTSTSGTLPRSAAHYSRKLSNSSHASHASSQDIPPQESGRDETGAPFYAPAPQNPARTWTSDANNMRLDALTISETDIKVTAKELTPSDFKHTSPGSGALSPIQESSTPSIDISYIQPDLEGVSIKATAINPTFVAKILSPVTSPTGPPSRPEPIVLDETTNSSNPSRPPLSRSTSSPEGRAIKTLEVVSAPENRRLTMNAGHTPNHSLTKLTWLKEDDGEATPKATLPVTFKGAIDRRASLALSLVSVPDDDEVEADEEENGDRQLSGPLGLVGDAAVDNPFLAALTEKLEEVKRSSEPASPRGSETSLDEDDEDDEDEVLEMPKLKIKSSLNFGRPMGRI